MTLASHQTDLDPGTETGSLITVWDLGIRLYHWLQALLITLLLATGMSGNGDSGPHIVAGLVLTVALGWRWIWGWIGSTTARFSHFPLSRNDVRHYLREGRHTEQGHNPLSAWMVLILLLGLSLQTASGLLMAGLIHPGDSLRDLIEPALVGWHTVFPKVLLALIAVHVIAAVAHGLKGDRVTTAMIDGRSREKPSARRLHFRSPWVSVLALLSALILITVTIVLSQL